MCIRDSPSVLQGLGHAADERRYHLLLVTGGGAAVSYTHLTDRNNADILMELFNQSVPGAKIENYTNAEGTTLENYYTILLSPVDFNDYL